MTWSNLRPWLGTVVRLFLGAVWIWAAVSKISDPRTFTQAVRAYDATPEWLSKAIGYGLPVLELSVGILLVVGIAVRVTAAVSAGLFVFFLIGIIEVDIRGIQLECGCFGGGGLTNGATHYVWDILRDLGLLVLAVFLVVWSFTHVSLEEFIARHDYVVPPSAKRMRTPEGRRKYEAMVAARRSEARSRALYTNGALAVVVVLVCIIGIGVQSGRAKIQGSIFAAHATASQGVTYGKPAAAEVDIYEDFQCPHCLEFEEAVGKTIDADVQANKAQVHFHTMSILDASSDGNRYSSRAANAALCASDISVDDFVAYHNILYGKIDGKLVQPTEGSDGRTNAQLISYAQHAGITGAALTRFSSCVDSDRHQALVQAIQEKSSEQGVNATPTIKVNGHSIAPTLAAWNAAIAAALKNGPAPHPSVTPSPSPSTSSSPAPSSSAASSAAAPSSSSSSSAARKPKRSKAAAKNS